MMDNDRAAFEKWATSVSLITTKDEDGIYLMLSTLDAWIGWKAAIAHAVPRLQPIETAPEGELVIGFWIDKDEPNHPERYAFDWLQDGVWQEYFNEHEHYLIDGAARGNSEDAPYTHWMPLPAAPAQGEKE